MEIIRIILQVIAAIGLLNVWLIRYSKATPYRGGEAKNMREEFSVYGLPPWSVYVIGALKICIAVALLIGIWVPGLVEPAAVLLVILMLGAFTMHLKLKDPIKRAVPSAAMLVIAFLIVAI